MKVRLIFEKNIRYISHLELMRAIQKILKRSGLPLRYSEGFNPHIILSVAVPIPVGVCGKNEFADFELTEEMPPETIFNALIEGSDNGILPKEIHINCIKSFNTVVYADYEIDIISSEADKIIEFLSRAEINTEKKAKGKIKIINLKDYIYKTEFEKTADGVKVKALLACGNEKNLNPMLIRKAIISENINIEVFNAVRLNVYDGDMNGYKM